jgi:phytoene dehydrogenase-like protein
LKYLATSRLLMKKAAVIIGAGPAGLTAALEFLRRSNVVPVVLEASQEIGGISRTIRYKGNRMDIGGHRFFSKSNRVMQWWIDLMPPDVADVEISYQGKKRAVKVPADLPEEPVLRGAGPIVVETDTDETDAEGHVHPEAHGHTETVVVAQPSDPDLVMLIRPRKSRIYYLRKFFDYPITLTATTLKNLGAVRTTRVGTSYILSRISQIKPEKSLEDFLINRFGRQLYLTFFKSYTASSACPQLRPRGASTPRPLQSPSCPRPKRSISRSKPRTCASIPSAPPARAASRSTRLTPPFASRIFPPIPS